MYVNTVMWSLIAYKNSSGEVFSFLCLKKSDLQLLLGYFILCLL